MATRKKRMYDSTNRKAMAEASRANILKIAQQLFIDDGYEQVTIGKIAQCAEVSEPTIYALFKSKFLIEFCRIRKNILHTCASFRLAFVPISLVSSNLKCFPMTPKFNFKECDI